MTPSIFISTFFGREAGAASQGLSAGGNAYKQALADGYSKEQAKTYATLVGTSEAALQYALGGISKLGGVSSEQLLTKVAGIDNALLRVAAAAGVKIGSEVTEEELQLFLEPLYRTLVFGEDYSAPAIEEIVYTALLAVITTGALEGGDIASYSKNINALLEQSKEQIKADGEKDLQSGNMPDDARLEIMKLNDPTARGMMAIFQMGKMEGAENDPYSGIVEFKAPPNATEDQIAQVQAYIDGCNEALKAGRLSKTGRVSTKGSLRDQASDAAKKEGRRAREAGTPYKGHVGHVPDTTWTGTPEPYSWLDLDPVVNTSLGGQTNRYPIGYKPTEFVFKEDE